MEGVDPVRREKLIELLDIDLHWRMHKVSDGQRRRVQICMGLLHPFKVTSVRLVSDHKIGKLIYMYTVLVIGLPCILDSFLSLTFSNQTVYILVKLRIIQLYCHCYIYMLVVSSGLG